MKLVCPDITLNLLRFPATLRTLVPALGWGRSSSYKTSTFLEWLRDGRPPTFGGCDCCCCFLCWELLALSRRRTNPSCELGRPASGPRSKLNLYPLPVSEVTLKTKSGRTLKVPLNKLSKPDQEFIAAKSSPKEPAKGGSTQLTPS